VSFHFGFSTGGPLAKAWLNGGAVCSLLNSKPNLLVLFAANIVAVAFHILSVK
jgi:hypothetical protein